MTVAVTLSHAVTATFILLVSSVLNHFVSSITLFIVLTKLPPN